MFLDTREKRQYHHQFRANKKWYKWLSAITTAMIIMLPSLYGAISLPKLIVPDLAWLGIVIWFALLIAATLGDKHAKADLLHIRAFFIMLQHRRINSYVAKQFDDATEYSKKFEIWGELLKYTSVMTKFHVIINADYYMMTGDYDRPYFNKFTINDLKLYGPIKFMAMWQVLRSDRDHTIIKNPDLSEDQVQLLKAGILDRLDQESLRAIARPEFNTDHISRLIKVISNGTTISNDLSSDEIFVLLDLLENDI